MPIKNVPLAGTNNPELRKHAVQLMDELFSQLQVKVTKNRNSAGQDTVSLAFPELGKAFVFDEASGEYLGNLNWVEPAPTPFDGPSGAEVFTSLPALMQRFFPTAVPRPTLTQLPMLTTESPRGFVELIDTPADPNALKRTGGAGMIEHEDLMEMLLKKFG